MVSIIIPAHNYGRYLGECVRSCVEQTVKPYEIIVVDDCSTDNTCDVVRDWIQRVEEPIIRLRRMPRNMGVSAARNYGLMEARGSLVVLLDADDMLTPNSIFLRQREFEKNPHLDMVHGYALKFGGDGSFEWCNKNAKHLRRSPKIKRQYIHAQCQMYRRDVFDRYGYYATDLRSKEDKDLLCRLGLDRESPLKPRIKVKYIDKPVAYYRRHPAAKHKRRIADKKWKEETDKIFKKHLSELRREAIHRA